MVFGFRRLQRQHPANQLRTRTQKSPEVRKSSFCTPVGLLAERTLAWVGRTIRARQGGGGSAPRANSAGTGGVQKPRGLGSPHAGRPRGRGFSRTRLELRAGPAFSGSTPPPPTRGGGLGCKFRGPCSLLLSFPPGLRRGGTARPGPPRRGVGRGEGAERAGGRGAPTSPGLAARRAHAVRSRGGSRRGPLSSSPTRASHGSQASGTALPAPARMADKKLVVVFGATGERAQGRPAEPGRPRGVGVGQGWKEGPVARTPDPARGPGAGPGSTFRLN